VLREFVAGRLAARWSPEQVSHALRGAFPDDRGRHLAHETIYQPSTGQSWAGCAGTCRGCCAPGGGTASRTAALMPAGQER
jgi:hypothetical protein